MSLKACVFKLLYRVFRVCSYPCYNFEEIKIKKEVSTYSSEIISLIKEFKDYLVDVDEEKRFIYFNYTKMPEKVREEFRKKLKEYDLEYLIDQPRIYRIKVRV